MGIGALATVLIGGLVGAIAFLSVSPTQRPPAVELSAEDVVSAQSSISTAKMMIDMIAATVAAGTSGISQAVEAIEPTFAAIDTATGAADQMSAGLDQAPDLQGAAAGIQGSAEGVEQALGRAESLASAAASLDGLIGPAVAALERAGLPETEELVGQLRAVQGAGGDLAAALGDVAGVRAEMRQISAAIGPAASEIDGSIDQARMTADRLREGLVSLSAARGDTEQAAESLVGGLDRLDSVLGSISDNLASARADLRADDEPPAPRFDHANRIGVGVAAGAGAALILLGVGAVWMRRAARAAG